MGGDPGWWCRSYKSMMITVVEEESGRTSSQLALLHNKSCCLIGGEQHSDSCTRNIVLPSHLPLLHCGVKMSSGRRPNSQTKRSTPQHNHIFVVSLLAIFYVCIALR